MTTYNTGNPVPSSDPRDASDNANVFDGFLNSSNNTKTDRLGRNRRTLSSYEGDIQSQIDAIPGRVETAIIRYSAINFTGDWVMATQYETNDVWSDGGTLYIVPSSYTSGASAAADITAGNAYVYQDADKIEPVNSAASLRAYEPLYDGQQVRTLGHTLPGIGSVNFYHDASDTTSVDNGGNVIVTEGGKRWIADSGELITVSMFGGIPGLSNSRDAIQRFIDSDHPSKVIDAEYSCDGYLEINDKTDMLFTGCPGAKISVYAGEINIARPINLEFIGVRFFGSSIARAGSGLPDRSTSNNFLSCLLGNPNQGTSPGIRFTNGEISVYKYRIGAINKENTPSIAVPITKCDISDNTLYARGDNPTAQTCGGFRFQRAYDGTTDHQHKIKGNRVIIDDDYRSDIGLEVWVANCDISNNFVIAPQRNGGYSGIVAGRGDLSRVNENYVYGFGAGLEIGNTGIGFQSVVGNVFLGCSYGITLTSSGQERSFVATGNVTLFDDAHTPRDGHIAAYRSKSPSSVFSGNIALHYDSNNPGRGPNDAGYYAGTGLLFNTADEHEQCVNNYFEGFEFGVRCSGLSESITVSSNVFNGCKYPVYDSGASPDWLFSGNIVRNFYSCRINKSISATGNKFYRDSDYTFASGRNISTAPWVQATISTDTLVSGFNNRFNRVNRFCSAPDSLFPESGVGAGRPDYELHDGIVIEGSDSFTQQDIKNSAALVGEEAIGRVARSYSGLNTQLIT